MSIGNLFPKKELTHKQERERYYELEFKKLRRKVMLHPLKLMLYYEQSMKLMDDAIKEGIYTEEQKQKQIYKVNIEMEKLNKFKSKFGR